MASSLDRLANPVDSAPGTVPTPVTVQWHAFELRPAGAPPMPPEYRARIAAARPQLYAIARERYGLVLNQGPFGINSRPALVGAKIAEHAGAGEAYHRAVMAAYWQEAQDISEPEVLADAAAAAGLERATFLDALQDPHFDRLVQDDVDQAHAYGLNGVPALIFANKYLVSGAQPLEVLQRVVARVAEEQASDTQDPQSGA